jgi:AraC-like DNA-binding protein
MKLAGGDARPRTGPAFRDAWLHRFIDALQKPVLEVPDREVAELVDDARRTVALVPDCTRLPERLQAQSLLSSWLVAVAIRFWTIDKSAVGEILFALAQASIGDNGFRETLEAQLTRFASILRIPAGSAHPKAVRIQGAKVRRVLAAIETRYAEPRLQLTLLARESHVTPTHLSRRLNAETGRRFSEHLNDRRIRAAHELVVTSDLSIKEVAAAVGYQQPTNLCREYRKRLGTTPDVARKRRASERLDATFVTG